MTKTPEILDAAVRGGVLGGAAVLAGTTGGDRFSFATGSAEPFGNGPPFTLDTIIDIASVTKVLATTTALLICRDRGLLDFNDPFTRHLPGYQPKLGDIPTLRQLATHTSGFRHDPSEKQRPYAAPTGPEILGNLLRLPPLSRPGECYEYACWNYLLLGLILEHVTGEPLAAFCQREIFGPLGMRGTSLGTPASGDPGRLARTFDAQHPGEVSDPFAFLIYRDGGCGGNAGAFATARDLAGFCRCLLRHGALPGGGRLFSEARFCDITEDATPGHPVARSIGWIMRDALLPASASGSRIYHSGWSGQTVFIDFGRECFVVVLTTRREDYKRCKALRFEIIEDLLPFFPAGPHPCPGLSAAG